MLLVDTLANQNQRGPKILFCVQSTKCPQPL